MFRRRFNDHLEVMIMKKKLSISVLLALLLSLTACGVKTSSENKPPVSQPSGNSQSSVDDSDLSDTSDKVSEVSKPNDKEISDNTSSESGSKQTAGADYPTEEIETDVENTISALESEYDKLIAEIDTYDKYAANTAKVKAFYDKVLSDTSGLCLRLREYGADYAEAILSADSSCGDKIEEFNDLYDCIYSDACDEMYDNIYNGILDDMYDTYYKDIVGDAEYSDYSAWYEVFSNEYDWWSDTHSDVFEEWSDLRADILDLYSDVRSELWSDDIERANKKLEKFKKDVEKLKNGSSTAAPATTAPTTTTTAATAPVADDTPSKSESSTGDLVDGMRPEFKEAMDSYESFYNEYCEFMKKYYENPMDFSLLSEYSEMMEKTEEVDEKFDAWDSEDMNEAEYKYYMEVSARVLQKISGIFSSKE